MNRFVLSIFFSALALALISYLFFDTSIIGREPLFIPGIQMLVIFSIIFGWAGKD